MLATSPAEHKLGEMLDAAKKAGQITKANTLHHVEGDDMKVTLSDAGISRDLSSRAQRIASIPEEEFKKQIEGTKPQV